ncbi:MAG: RNA pseudouridine synthase [Patescibacteria group bacterium]
MDIKIIYEDNDLLVVDKPAGIIVIPELIDELIKKYPSLADIGDPPRYGIVHRLDKDTSGILLVAKTSESLIFLQNQFISREVEKKYVCLVEGVIKEDKGEIKTLIARSQGDKRKQNAYPLNETGPGKREAITEYKVLEKFKDYTLLEVKIKTGRKHQIRCHLSYIHHPIAGDKMYGFKNSPVPEGLTRQFLHAEYLKIKLLNGEVKEFYSELPEDLKHVKIIRPV